VSDPLPLVASASAAGQIPVAEESWRAKRPKAPHAFREDQFPSAFRDSQDRAVGSVIGRKVLSENTLCCKSLKTPAILCG